MRPIIRIIARALFRAGGLGLLTLGAFDSSPLIVPLGNDLLVLALCARYHDRMIYYAVMATVGSLIGVFVTDWLSRKGAARLTKTAPGEPASNLQRQVQKRAAWSLFVASLLPPPFPFTAIVAAAAAFRYPRKNLLTVVGVGQIRALRHRRRAGDSLWALDHPAGEIADPRRRHDRAHRDFDCSECHLLLSVEPKKQGRGPTGCVSASVISGAAYRLSGGSALAGWGASTATFFRA